MSVPSYNCLTVTVADRIARIRFTRPDLLNRFDRPQHDEFVMALLDLSRNPNIRVLIISAEGKAFSAGGDMDMIIEMHNNKDLRDHMTSEAKVLFDVLNDLPYPVIAAVQGAAIGLGATVVTCADIIVTARAVKISDPHIVLGLVAGDGGIFSWARAIGMTRAKRYLLTGDPITGEQAYAMGLVTDLVNDPAEVEPLAEKIAQKILALPRDGIRGTKKAFAALAQQYAGGAFEVGLAYEGQTLAGDEVRDTVLALTKRST